MSYISKRAAIKTSLTQFFTRDKKREERLKALADILEAGTEEQYLELLVSWGVPQNELASLLNEFRWQRCEKRGLLR